MVLASTNRLRPTQIVDASVQLLNEAPRALRSRQRVRVHLGAAEVLARVRVLATKGEISPGKRGLVQFRFEAPVVGVLGDRFIVRAYSPQVTIGGGTILDPFGVKHRGRDFPAIRATLEILAKGDRAARFAQFVQSAGVAGVSRGDIAARTAWREAVIDTIFAEAKTDGPVLQLDDRFISRAALDEVNRQVAAEVAAHHQR